MTHWIMFCGSTTNRSNTEMNWQEGSILGGGKGVEIRKWMLCRAEEIGSRQKAFSNGVNYQHMAR